MKNVVLELLKRINDFGYQAYAVGGYVRDFLINKKSNDIDITTSATPMELKNIFPNVVIPKINYGSVSLVYKNIRFEITTFRKEDNYLDNRHPNKIEYVSDLKTDLLRRDFTINAICMDKEGKIIDLLDGRKDLDKKIIRTIGDSYQSFSSDALRILRAIRFATTLQFTLSEDIILAISKTKYLLKSLSYDRKKGELDYIFASKYAKEGINLLIKLDLLKDLEIENIIKVKDYSDIIGIWAMINPSHYRFSKSEMELIKKINLVYKMDDIDNYTLYKYGLYVNLLASLNKGISKKIINERYQDLPIKVRSDIDITPNIICEKLKRQPGSFLKDIYDDLEKKILNKKLENKENILLEYIVNNY